VTEEPTFNEYADASRMNGLRPTETGQEEGTIRWLCNPNNPTGLVLTPSEVFQRAESCQMMILDQSYEDYTLAPLPSVSEIVNRENILQLHSLTKTYAVPGLRIGYVVGNASLISRMRRFMRPWSVNALAIEAAMWLIRHKAEAVTDLPAYLAEANRLRQRLNEISGISVEPTQTNFMLGHLEGLTAAQLKERLAKEYGILIRDASNFQSLSPYYFRVATQTPEENDLLVEAIKTIMTSGSNFNPTTQNVSTSETKLHPVMLAGTGSDVGKSVLAAALCRIFRQDGYCPAPFKAQNMALNSYATPEGLEIGRAQAMQAEAAGIACHTDMNPLLLKPQSDHTSQVVLHGRPIGNRDAYDYWRRGDEEKEDGRENIDFRKEVCSAYDRLAAQYNPIVMEGAGSISELNLKETDLVNMPMARYAQADVLLVADIDRGGVFASVYGSIALQSPQDRALIRGIIINKFRGDLRLFDEGRQMLEELCGVPVLGVIPYFRDIHIEEEDSVALERKVREENRREGEESTKEKKVSVAVVLLRHISNYTDFDALEQDPRISLFYTDKPAELQCADIIILPGSKSTLDDLNYLRENGYAEAILQAHRNGSTVIGICGGFQIMGTEVCDPDHVEGETERLPGLGLLPVSTSMSGSKVTRQTTFSTNYTKAGEKPLHGYEIHMGQTQPLEGTAASPFAILDDGRQDGYMASPRCWGTYLHGVLDNAPIIDALLAPWANRLDEASRPFDYTEFKEKQYDLLADHVRRHLDMDRLYEILKKPRS